MKLGTEKKGEVIALVALLVVGGGLLWRNLGSSPAVPAPALPLPGATAPAASAGSALPFNLSRLDPTLHMAQLDALRQQTYTGSGRDLFHLGPPPPPPPTPAQIQARKRAAEIAQHPQPALPVMPPPPPPIPLKFYGFAQAAGLPERIFLQLGEDTFVVSAGETVSHRYLIESIGKLSVRVKDMVTSSEQELPLQQGS